MRGLHRGSIRKYCRMQYPRGLIRSGGSGSLFFLFPFSPFRDFVDGIWGIAYAERDLDDRIRLVDDLHEARTDRIIDSEAPRSYTMEYTIKIREGYGQYESDSY